MAIDKLTPAELADGLDQLDQELRELLDKALMEGMAKVLTAETGKEQGE